MQSETNKMKKVASVFSDFRTIYLGLALVGTSIVWAGDARYLKVSEATKMVTQITLSSLQDRAEELEIERGWESDQKRIKVLDSLIKIKRMRIDALLKSQSLR